MTIPSLNVSQNGISQISDANLNTYLQSGALVANLRSFIGISGMMVALLGYTAPNDGGNGFFYWNASGTAPDDNGVTTIVPNGVTVGCWTRLGSSSGGGGGTVTSVSNSDSSLTISPTTGNVVASLGSYGNNTILSNISGSSAQPIGHSLTSLIDVLIGSTQGSIIYRNASSWVALTPGTNGQVLQSQGAAANPQWASTSVPTATSSSLGIVQPDGTIITVSAGLITVPKGTSGTFGVVKVDGTTITSSSGVISATSNLPTALGVGSWIIAADTTDGSWIAGSTVPGSHLTTYNVGGTGTSTSLSGSWQAMDKGLSASGATAVIWQRVA